MIAPPEINSSDPAFLFGQILTEITNLKTTTNTMTDKFASLPCMVHKEELSDLMEWHDEYQEKQKERTKLVLSLKTGLVIAVCSSLVSSGVTIVLDTLLRT